MATINSYLTFLGNCETAFNFYKSVFGGDFTYLGRYGEMPPQEGVTLSESDLNKIMHVSLPINKNAVLMGSDAGETWAPATIIGNNISLSITAESREEADLLFLALSENGRITMPMEPTFWGDYFGMCTDQFQINWMISFNPNNN